MKINRRNKEKEGGGFLARTLKDESGIVLAIALMVMGVMAVVGAGIISTATTDVKIASNVTGSMQALSVAEAGVSNAINYIRSDPSWGPDLNKNGNLQDDAQLWATQNTGTIQMGKVDGTYSIEVFDATGTFGRSRNDNRSDRYTTLGGSDVLVEVTGTVSGVTRKVGLVVRNQVTAFDYATYSYGTIDGTGSGNNPGKFTGKIYGKDQIQLQGNYDLTAANAESNGGTITPNCNSGKFATCNENATAVTPPVLDFSYYQDQNNFATQQVFKMTPTVGSSSGCGGNCTTWPINYEMTTGGTSYTVTATVQAQKTGSTYNHTVYWCTDPNWNGTIGSCSGTQSTYTFSSKKAENSKPFVDAFQFNSYTAPTGYTSSVVNIFDAQGHLEFLGPSDPNQTATVTASILVGTAANNTTPVGKIDIEGGAGTLNFQPANGLAIVAEKVEFKAKYSDISVNVGTATNGAAIIATKDFEVEAEKKNGTTANFNMNGSLVVGSTANSENEMEIGGQGVNANFTYTTVNNLPQGWQDYGSMTIQRREWRELS